MSLLMFSHERDGIVVMTDTYATTPTGGPRTFTSKVYALPHLNLVIGGTGVGQLAERWFAEIQSNMLVRDIETLDLHAPAALRALWAGFHDEFKGFARAVEDGSTSTIYHFGFTEEGQPIRYAYRSASNFESEESMEPGFGIKPQPDWDFDVPVSLEDMVAVAVRRRQQEDAKPKTARVHLGGDLIATFIGNGSIQSQCVFR